MTKLKQAMPICLKHNVAHKTKYPYKSCYYNEDLKGGAKGSQNDVVHKTTNRQNGSSEKPAQPPKCRLQSCGWNYGGECRCPNK